MLIYSSTKRQFDRDVINGSIAKRIEQQFYLHGLPHQNDSEVLAWNNSLREMQKVLDHPSFHDSIQVAIEYHIPQTAKRIDFLIAGENDNSQENVVVVELKQWEEAGKTSRHGIVTAFTGGMVRAVAHPSYQAYSYAKTIENFNATVQDESIGMWPCAYLHNYKKSKLNELVNPLYADVIDLAPLYIKNEEDKLRNFIKKFITKAPSRNLLYIIDNGRIRPSKALQDALGSMLKGNEEFIMIDEQKVVYETILRLVEIGLAKDKKYTVIVQGGPGTGKSVVAIQILVELVARRGLNAQYVTKNAAPRNVYFEELKREKYKLSYVKNLFKGSGSYYDCAANTFDCLIADEAHRLNAKSGMYQNLGENQIKEIINASRVSVFFIDEDQIVTTKDIGSVDEIKRCAQLCGSEVFCDDTTKLVSQFRCNGSDGYLAFIDDLLGIRDTANFDGFDGEYDIRIFDNPCEMRETLRDKNRINNKARMVAGYCYEWRTKNSNDLSVFDIELEHDFRARWNFATTQTGAIDADSFDQVGCCHTAQGLEFDYVGVIIGRDLVYRNNRVITDPSQRARSDKSLTGLKSNPNPELADKIIRNTYKTLLTRGQKGCYIYCEDPDLMNYLRHRLASVQKR